MPRQIVLIAHDLRSIHNVGSLIRTAEGLGVKQMYISGYTPYPKRPHDQRLPHLADKINRQIAKTALGADKHLKIAINDDVAKLIKSLKKQGYQVVGLEQDTASITLHRYIPPAKIALIVGNEVTGLPKKITKHCDQLVEIPMKGQKESFNVVQAAAMALYHLSWYN